ncbi:MAG TPA: hypothetical protein VGH42_03240 [Verrucomicrobiae bacterium]|jgi:hypothetical protein
MNQIVSTKDPTIVAKEVQAAYKAMFPQGDLLFVPRVFGWAMECFTGHYADYQAVDADYHDFEHTLQGTLCMVHLLRGRHLAAAQPPVTRRMFELGLTAILLHDTGYLKKRDDTDGTGAKYTATHVNRSANFAAELLGEKGFSREDIKAVQNMIRCTGVDADLSDIPFQNELEKIVGFALGTADLLGQMAADDYVEKLPVLYEEFAEAGRNSASKSKFVNMFSSAKDLLRKTPDFWEKYVKPKLNGDFDGQHRYISDPYPDGPNFYMDKIESNIQRLRELISSEENTTRFLKKYHAAFAS